MKQQLILRWEFPEGNPQIFDCELDDGKAKLTLGRDPENSVFLDHPRVSRHHATLRWNGSSLELIDENSANGTLHRGARISSARLDRDDTFDIGPFRIAVSLQQATTGEPVGPAPTQLYTGSATELLAGAEEVPSSIPDAFTRDIVSERQIEAEGFPTAESPYLAVGGGIGSFVWVDHLRVYGVPAEDIGVIGLEEVPYHKYRRLCEASQIPPHERLRSNAESCPDNIWGYPGYALREFLSSFARGELGRGLKCAWQVFGEPALAESYTPRAGDVYRSLDAEAQRIGWRDMLISGKAVSIRKTDRGRYAILFQPRSVDPSGRKYRVHFAKYLHLCVGYPGTRLLDDLQKYRIQTSDALRVVNAFEDHEHIYDSLRRDGGTVVLRGRGIVASRILQRIWETRRAGAEIRVLHLMRSPTVRGSRYGSARRRVFHHWEFQPFNWPKSCWGGELRRRLERSSPRERSSLYECWGGTTTANRSDWIGIIRQGIKENWYLIRFGRVLGVRQGEDGRLVTSLSDADGGGKAIHLPADYIIDCTGLVPDVENDRLLRDLIETYALERNYAYREGRPPRPSGIAVSRNFEIEGMRHETARVYSAGVVTSLGPMAAVDSFLGLQFSAIHSVEELRRLGAPQVGSMHFVRSFSQWLKWCFRKSP